MRSARETTAEVEANFPSSIMKRALTNRKNYAPEEASRLRPNAVADSGHASFTLLTFFPFVDICAALVGGLSR